MSVRNANNLHTSAQTMLPGPYLNQNGSRRVRGIAHVEVRLLLSQKKSTCFCPYEIIPPLQTLSPWFSWRLSPAPLLRALAYAGAQPRLEVPPCVALITFWSLVGLVLTSYICFPFVSSFSCFSFTLYSTQRASRDNPPNVPRC